MITRLVQTALLACALVLSPTACWGFQSARPLLVHHQFTKPAFRQIHNSQDDQVARSSTTALAALPQALVTGLGSPLGSISVLAFIVLFHESGHYLAARAFGIKVEEFSVGIGPKLLGVNKFGNEFSLRALPLGGYVKFPENYNQTLVRQQSEAAMEAEKDVRGNSPQVATLLNILTLGNYKRIVQRDQEQFYQEQERKMNPLLRVFGVKPNKPKEPEILDDDVEIDYYDDPDLLQNRPWGQRAVVIAGGVAFNLLLAFMIYFGQISTQGLGQPTFANGAVVSSVPRADAASAGLLRRGDVIVSLNGAPLSEEAALVSKSMTSAAAQESISNFITKIRATEPGDELELAVKRQSQTLNVVVKPAGAERGQAQSIGVMLAPNYLETIKIQSSSIPQASKLAYQSVKDITTETTKGVVKLLSQLVLGNNNGAASPVGQSVSGPVGLIKAGSDVVSTRDLASILLFAAAISINLAVINSLPLPALDGGQMVFVLFEAISGRKVDQELQETITAVSVLMLLSVTVSTTFGDVTNLLGGR